MGIDDKYEILKENIIIMLKHRNNKEEIKQIELPSKTHKNNYDLEIENELLVKFLVDEKDISIKKIEDILRYEYNFFIFIVCVGNKLTTSFIEIGNNENIQVFHWKFFMFNILEHKYVPKFEKITHSKLKVEQLPIILSTDIMAKYYNMKHGDIYKITRNNYITYRVCRHINQNIKSIVDESIRKDRSTITITFSEVVENHPPPCEQIGEMAKEGEGFSVGELMNASKIITALIKDTNLNEKIQVEYHNLSDLLDDTDYEGEGDEAGLLVIKNGLEFLDINSDQLFDEVSVLKVDKIQPGRGNGVLVNSKARFNLCFADYSQQPNYKDNKYRIVNFENVEISNKLRTNLPKLFNEMGNYKKAQNLFAEGNYYYNMENCGIGWHGDAERRKVIGVRLGVTMPLAYQWFINSQPIGKFFKIDLNHGDIYIMSEKTVGTDWKNTSKLTLRHSAGCDKYLDLSKKMEKDTKSEEQEK